MPCLESCRAVFVSVVAAAVGARARASVGSDAGGSVAAASGVAVVVGCVWVGTGVVAVVGGGGACGSGVIGTGRSSGTYNHEAMAS